jgi:hypothetical protein
MPIMEGYNPAPELVAKDHPGDIREVHGLVLEATGLHKNEFRRVGIFWANQEICDTKGFRRPIYAIPTTEEEADEHKFAKSALEDNLVHEDACGAEIVPLEDLVKEGIICVNVDKQVKSPAQRTAFEVAGVTNGHTDVKEVETIKADQRSDNGDPADSLKDEETRNDPVDTDSSASENSFSSSEGEEEWVETVITII